MSYTTLPASLMGPALLTTTASVLYTSPALTNTVVTRISVNNSVTTATGLLIWLVRNGGSTSAGNQVIGIAGTGLSMTGGATEPYVVNSLAGAVLGPGDALWGSASAANALVIYGSGWTQQ